MFFIGCAECKDSDQVAVEDKMEAMLVSLRHERGSHPQRWNITKQAALDIAEFWSNQVPVLIMPMGRPN